MSTSAVRAGSAFVEIGIKSRIAAGVKAVENDLNSLGNRIGGIGAAISAASGSLLAAPLMAASRMQETLSKFNQVFGDSSAEVGDWAKTTARAVGVTEEGMLSMLASTQSLLVPMGLLPSQANEMSKTLSALAVDLGSFNNMETADVFRDLMAAMTGESEPMKKYGAIVNETAVKQELLNMSLDPRFANDAAKAQARLNIIMRATTAAQGDAIRTSDSFANQMKALWSSIMDTSAAIGGNLVQDIADLIKVAVSGVYAVRDFVKENSDLVRAFGIVTLASAGVGASMVATGVALKVAAAGMSVLGVASQAAAMVAGVAWSGLSLAFTALTIKSRITAAIIKTGWSVAAAAIGVAWTALTGALSVAMQGLIAVATVTAIVSPWVAAAGAIAVAWFGLDTVMATLALGAAAAWTASAGTVTAAWVSAAGVLVPLAGVIATAYTGAAGLISSAFLALRAAYASSGAVGVAWAVASAGAWAAYGAVVQAIAIKQAIDAFIVSAAWKAAALLASAAWAGFTTVLTIAASPSTWHVAAAGAVGAAWGVAAGIAKAAWAAAWVVISGPALPIIAAVAAIGAIGVAAGYAAIAGADFGKAWGIVTETFKRLVGVVNVAFDAIKNALGSGDYAAATQALWLGIQAGFWVGVDGALKAFKWLFSEAWAATKRFFSSMLDFAWRTMKAIGRAILNPLSAAKEIGNAIGELVGGATSFDVGARVDSSKAALKALRDQVAATKARNDAEKEAAAIREGQVTNDEKRAKRLKEINDLEMRGALSAIEAAKERARLDAEMPASKPSEVARSKRDEEFARIDLRERSGQLSKDDANKARAAVDANIKSAELQEKRDGLKTQLDQGLITPGEFEKQMAGLNGLSASYFDLVKGIEMEILALEQGEEAAERKRLADEGLNAQQIKDVEALKAKKKALEEMKTAQEAAMQKRVDGIFGKADELGQAGMSPAEIFKRVMAQIDDDQQAGRIDGNVANDARGRAQEDLQGRMDGLRDEGRALAEALRTPGEKLAMELKRITALQDAGAIDEKTALRAEDKAREDFAQTQAKQVDETLDQEKTMGPTGTFSGFAIAGGAFNGGQQNLQKEMVTLLKDNLKEAKQTAKNTKEKRIARAG